MICLMYWKFKEGQHIYKGYLANVNLHFFFFLLFIDVFPFVLGTSFSKRCWQTIELRDCFVLENMLLTTWFLVKKRLRKERWFLNDRKLLILSSVCTFSQVGNYSLCTSQAATSLQHTYETPTTTADASR